MNLLKPEKLLRIPLKILPSRVHEYLFSKIGTVLIDEIGLREQISPLNGKTICIRILDSNDNFHFRIHNVQLTVGKENHWDVRISGNIADFWALINQEEDPDTLFFARRLNMEGDTGTGIYVKNLLDSIGIRWQEIIPLLFGGMKRKAQILLR